MFLKCVYVMKEQYKKTFIFTAQTEKNIKNIFALVELQLGDFQYIAKK
jgi:hypothetical protein